MMMDLVGVSHEMTPVMWGLAVLVILCLALMLWILFDRLWNGFWMWNDRRRRDVIQVERYDKLREKQKEQP